MNRCRWNISPRVPDSFLNSAAGFPPLIAQLIYNRGLRQPSQIHSFLNADSSLVGDPFLLPEMHQAVTRIYRALLSGENIAVYGDYDVDGITATALLVQGLTALGGRAVPYIPHRLKEGYGLRHAALESLHQQGISLVITVDCGITSLDEVKAARRLGLDVIITDHHAPLVELPHALATINPRLAGSAYPFTELSGAGVAFKLLQALFRNIGKKEPAEKLMDLVALGTVADISPLLGENRYLVKEGLKRMQTNPRLGLAEMAAQAKLDIAKLDCEGISWLIAPRLNAAGRLEHALSGYNLLMTDSPQEACELALYLEEKNAERQRLTGNSLNRAREQVMAQGIAPLLFVADESYPVGIAGLVANRLLEEFYRPAIVVRSGEAVSSGSCRSIPEFNIVAALNQCRGLLTQFGGHSQAAGFSLPSHNLETLKEQLFALAAAQLEGVDLRARLDIDAEIALPELAGDTFMILQQLAPFGRANPAPTFVSRNVDVVDCRAMGKGTHLKLKLRQKGMVWDAVGFDLGGRLNEISRRMDVVYSLEKDSWNGLESLRLNLLDFAPVSPSAA